MREISGHRARKILPIGKTDEQGELT